jgi:uncharacterized protein YlxW (UPF0749 family)
MTDMKRIREALCLFKSMVDCGERASQTSSEAFENAMGDSLAVDAELTALRADNIRFSEQIDATQASNRTLRAEVKTYENEVAQSHINELRLANEVERLTKERIAERRAIAEAVRQVCSNDTANRV